VISGTARISKNPRVEAFGKPGFGRKMH
jgi:hypothetical protein